MKDEYVGIAIIFFASLATWDIESLSLSTTVKELYLD